MSGVSYYEDDYQQQGAGGPAIKARLKWFNVSKGFGFVSPVDGAADAFLHVSVLNRIGMQQMNEGAEVMCEIGQGQKGPQVMRITEVLSEGQAGQPRSAERPPRPQRPAFDSHASGPEEEVNGTVKWFKHDKGFGFVTADGSDQDVFVHKSVLQRAGLQGLETGQRVQMRVQSAQKGREATWIQMDR